MQNRHVPACVVITTILANMEKVMQHFRPAPENGTKTNPLSGFPNDNVDTFTQHQMNPLSVLKNDEASPISSIFTPDRNESVTKSIVCPLQKNTLEASINDADLRSFNFEIDFDEDDPENPKAWPPLKRSYIISVISFTTWVVVFYSSSYTAGLTGMMDEFEISSKTLATLGLTSYMLGLAVGFSMLAPLSEIYGRRMVYMISYGLFFLLVLPCALARSLTEIILARFFGYVILFKVNSFYLSPTLL